MRLAAAKNPAALGALLDHHRDRLKVVIRSRMDRRAQGRIDPSDVIQEVLLEAYSRIDDYLDDPSVSLFVWLRFLARQRLAMMLRRHLGAQARDARREVPLPDDDHTGASAAVLAAQLAARLTSPSAALSRVELRARLIDALDRLDSKSREILVLRHFEQLSNQEAAEVLRTSPTAACNRYVRALGRIKAFLGTTAGGGSA